MLKITLFITVASTGCMHHGVHHGANYGYAAPVVVQPQAQPTYVDTQGRPVYLDARGQPVYIDGQPVDPASIVSTHAPGQTAPVAPVVITPPAVIYQDDHHVDHHDAHH